MSTKIMKFKSKSRTQPQKQKQQFRILPGSIRSKSTTTPILCKKHPKHKQTPGVCAVCLREKLNALTSSKTQNATNKNNAYGSSCSSSSLSSLSSHASSNASSCASPHHVPHRSYSSVTCLRTGKKVLTNSRSMAASRPERVTAIDDQIKKKQGFWSKFLHPRKSENQRFGGIPRIH